MVAKLAIKRLCCIGWVKGFRVGLEFTLLLLHSRWCVGYEMMWPQGKNWRLVPGKNHGYGWFFSGQ